jgi:hypothetical protein
LSEEKIMSVFGKDFGLIHEAMVTGRKVGATERFWSALAHHQDVFERTVAFVLSLIQSIFYLRADFEYGSHPRFKSLRRDSQTREGAFIPVLGEIANGAWIDYDELERLMKESDAVGGQRHLEAMVRDQDVIPVEWRGYEVIAPATAWLLEGGGENAIPVLQFFQKKWGVIFRFSSAGFGGQKQKLLLVAPMGAKGVSSDVGGTSL